MIYLDIINIYKWASPSCLHLLWNVVGRICKSIVRCHFSDNWLDSEFTCWTWIEVNIFCGICLAFFKISKWNKNCLSYASNIAFSHDTFWALSYFRLPDLTITRLFVIRIQLPHGYLLYPDLTTKQMFIKLFCTFWIHENSKLWSELTKYHKKLRHYPC